MSLDAFLDPDPRDPGCGETMDLLHVYAEQRLSRPVTGHPGIEAHLKVCDPCSTDLQGLLALLTSEP